MYVTVRARQACITAGITQKKFNDGQISINKYNVVRVYSAENLFRFGRRRHRRQYKYK